MCISLEQSYNYHCLQEFCCVFSVQTVYWEFHLLYGNFKNADNSGKHE